MGIHKTNREEGMIEFIKRNQRELWRIGGKKTSGGIFFSSNPCVARGQRHPLARFSTPSWLQPIREFVYGCHGSSTLCAGQSNHTNFLLYSSFMRSL